MSQLAAIQVPINDLEYVIEGDDEDFETWELEALWEAYNNANPEAEFCVFDIYRDESGKYWARLFWEWSRKHPLQGIKTITVDVRLGQLQVWDEPFVDPAGGSGLHSHE
jgi:hypothetical protein